MLDFTGSNRNFGDCCLFYCNGAELGSASVPKHCYINTHTDICTRHGQTCKEHCWPSRGSHRRIERHRTLPGRGMCNERSQCHCNCSRWENSGWVRKPEKQAPMICTNCEISYPLHALRHRWGCGTLGSSSSAARAEISISQPRHWRGLRAGGTRAGRVGGKYWRHLCANQLCRHGNLRPVRRGVCQRCSQADERELLRQLQLHPLCAAQNEESWRWHYCPHLLTSGNVWNLRLRTLLIQQVRTARHGGDNSDGVAGTWCFGYVGPTMWHKYAGIRGRGEVEATRNENHFRRWRTLGTRSHGQSYSQGCPGMLQIFYKYLYIYSNIFLNF